MEKCEIQIRPLKEQGHYTRTEVVMQVQRDWEAQQDAKAKLSKTQPAMHTQTMLCSIPITMHSVPGCEAKNLVITDDRGVLPYQMVTEDHYPYLLSIVYPQRRPEGTVTASYWVTPRVITDADHCGPYLDFREEDGGVNSCGSAFLLDFPGLNGTITLKWELPTGDLGVCAFGEGDLTFQGELDTIRDCYYAFGQLKKRGNEDFGIYWLTEPDFDMEAIADYAAALFPKMAEFFGDPDPTYRIFVRKDPFKHSGGSATNRSYMFGWNDTEPVTLADKKNLLAHEMVHNWAGMDDNPFGITTWYNEGCAEYYSVILPYRFGMITKEEAKREIQTRKKDYYANPRRNLSNEEAGRLSWEDPKAQVIPYGRGFLFLANIEAMIRETTFGQRSLDDAVKYIWQRHRMGKHLNNDVFLDTVRAISGLSLYGEFERMRRGEGGVLRNDIFAEILE